MLLPSPNIFINWREWAEAITARLGPVMSRLETQVDVPALRAYAKAALPSAVANKQRMIYVTDEIGGAVPAFSDGTNWRRVTDRAIVS